MMGLRVRFRRSSSVSRLRDIALMIQMTMIRTLVSKLIMDAAIIQLNMHIIVLLYPRQQKVLEHRGLVLAARGLIY